MERLACQAKQKCRPAIVFLDSWRPLPQSSQSLEEPSNHGSLSWLPGRQRTVLYDPACYLLSASCTCHDLLLGGSGARASCRLRCGFDLGFEVAVITWWCPSNGSRSSRFSNPEECQDGTPSSGTGAPWFSHIGAWVFSSTLEC